MEGEEGEAQIVGEWQEREHDEEPETAIMMGPEKYENTSILRTANPQSMGQQGCCHLDENW